MMSRFRWTLVVNAILAPLLVGMTGCGDPGIGAVKVSGTVKLDGAPVRGASVIFNPDQGGQAAAGLTDAEGKYKLTTEKAGDGAVPGSYKISITKNENETLDLPTKVDPNDSKSMDAIYSKIDTRKKQKSTNVIPEMYANPKGSGLSAEVKGSGTNNFDFELKGKK